MNLQKNKFLTYLEVVICERFNSWETLKNPDDGWFSQTKEIFTIHEVREDLDNLGFDPDSLHLGENFHPDSSTGCVCVADIVMASLHNLNTELWLVVLLLN